MSCHAVRMLVVFTLFCLPNGAFANTHAGTDAGKQVRPIGEPRKLNEKENKWIWEDWTPHKGQERRLAQYETWTEKAFSWIKMNENETPNPDPSKISGMFAEIWSSIDNTDGKITELVGNPKVKGSTGSLHSLEEKLQGATPPDPASIKLVAYARATLTEVKASLAGDQDKATTIANAKAMLAGLPLAPEELDRLLSAFQKDYLAKQADLKAKEVQLRTVGDVLKEEGGWKSKTFTDAQAGDKTSSASLISHLVDVFGGKSSDAQKAAAATRALLKSVWKDGQFVLTLQNAQGNVEPISLGKTVNEAMGALEKLPRILASNPNIGIATVNDATQGNDLKGWAVQFMQNKCGTCHDGTRGAPRTVYPGNYLDNPAANKVTILEWIRRITANGADPMPPADREVLAEADKQKLVRYLTSITQ